jgi:hypothetical protein
MHTPESNPSPTGLQPQHGLIPWDTYQQQNALLFPTPESWRWFVRQNRAELVEAGALCFVAGRLFVLPQAFGQAVVNIGMRLAALRSA